MIHDDSVPNQSADSDANTIMKQKEIEVYGDTVEVEYNDKHIHFIETCAAIVVSNTELWRYEVMEFPTDTVVELACEIFIDLAESFDAKWGEM